MLMVVKVDVIFLFPFIILKLEFHTMLTLSSLQLNGDAMLSSVKVLFGKNIFNGRSCASFRSNFTTRSITWENVRYLIPYSCYCCSVCAITPLSSGEYFSAGCPKLDCAVSSFSKRYFTHRKPLYLKDRLGSIVKRPCIF